MGEFNPQGGDIEHKGAVAENKSLSEKDIPAAFVTAGLNDNRVFSMQLKAKQRSFISIRTGLLLCSQQKSA